MSIEALTEQFQTTLGEVEDERDEIYTAYQQKVDECTNLHEDVEAWSRRYDEILNEGRQLHAQFTARGERIKLMEREKLEDKARMEVRNSGAIPAQFRRNSGAIPGNCAQFFSRDLTRLRRWRRRIPRRATRSPSSSSRRR